MERTIPTAPPSRGPAGNYHDSPLGSGRAAWLHPRMLRTRHLSVGPSCIHLATRRKATQASEADVVGPASLLEFKSKQGSTPTPIPTSSMTGSGSSSKSTTTAYTTSDPRRSLGAWSSNDRHGGDAAQPATTAEAPGAWEQIPAQAPVGGLYHQGSLNLPASSTAVQHLGSGRPNQGFRGRGIGPGERAHTQHQQAMQRGQQEQQGQQGWQERQERQGCQEQQRQQGWQGRQGWQEQQRQQGEQQWQQEQEEQQGRQGWQGWQGQQGQQGWQEREGWQQQQQQLIRECTELDELVELVRVQGHRLTLFSLTAVCHRLPKLLGAQLGSRLAASRTGRGRGPPPAPTHRPLAPQGHPRASSDHHTSPAKHAMAQALLVLQLCWAPLARWAPSMSLRNLSAPLWAAAKLSEHPDLRAFARQMSQLVVLQLLARGPAAQAAASAPAAAPSPGPAPGPGPHSASSISTPTPGPAEDSEGSPSSSSSSGGGGVYTDLLPAAEYHAQFRALAELVCLQLQQQGIDVYANVATHGPAWLPHEPFRPLRPLLANGPHTASTLLYSLALLGVRGKQQQALRLWVAEGFLAQGFEPPNPQDLSNAAYALALLADPLPPLWAPLSHALLDQLQRPGGHGFNSVALSNISWALSKLGSPSPRLRPALGAAVAAACDAEHSGLGLSNLLWAAACLELEASSGLYARAEPRVILCLRGMEVQLLANVLWAYGTVEAACPALLAAAADHLAKLPPWRLGQHSTALANTLYAFAKLEFFDDRVFQTYTHMVEQGVTSMSAMERLMVLWAYSRYWSSRGSAEDLMHQRLLLSHSLLSRLVQHIIKDIPTYRPMEVGTLAVSLCALTWYDEQALDLLYAQAARLLPEMILCQLNSLSWCLTKLGRAPPQLVTQVLEASINAAVNTEEGKLTASVSEISQVAWALGLMEPTNWMAAQRLFQALGEVPGLTILPAVATRLAQAVLSMRDALPASQLTWMEQQPVQTLVTRCLEGYLDVLQSHFTTASSATQLQVYQELKGLPGVTCGQLEATTQDGMFYIDVALVFRGRHVAVEVDGPLHFMLNRQGLVTGDTLWRRRRLFQRGYAVLPLRASEFTDLDSSNAREKLLLKLLVLAVDSPERLAAREKSIGDALRPEDHNVVRSKPGIHAVRAAQVARTLRVRGQPPGQALRTQYGERRGAAVTLTGRSRGAAGTLTID